MKSLEEIIIDLETDDFVYENEYMIVYKVIAEIPTHSLKWVKRVQIIKWKMKNSDKLEIDIRRYSKKENKYAKGISFTQREYFELVKALEENYDDIINFF